MECLRTALPRESTLVCDLTAAATWCHHLLEVYLVEVTARIPWPPIETIAGMFAQAEMSTR